MALFKKKSPEEKTITELEEYYSGKKSRPFMAWVMAVISLLVTVAVVSGLFFGGRWVYQKIAHRNDTNQTTTQTTSSTTSSTNSNSSNSNSTNKGSSTDFPSVVSDQAATTSVPSNTRNTSTTSSNIPNTGPGESALVIISSVFVLSYIISLIRQKANQ